MSDTNDIAVELIDGTDPSVLGLIVIRSTDDGNADVQFKGLRIGRLELAVLLMRAGRELKRQHDEGTP